MATSTKFKTESLEFIGEWMKKNDVVEFRSNEFFIKRVEQYKPSEQPKPQESFVMPEPQLSDNEQLFGVGAIEWQR